MTIEENGTHPKIGNLNFGQIHKLSIFFKMKIQKIQFIFAIHQYQESIPSNKISHL
jgi:hypothetical protein